MPYAPESLSALNPPLPGDTVRVGGRDWIIAISPDGWLLHELGDRTEVHPKIRDIPSVNDFITAMIEETETRL